MEGRTDLTKVDIRLAVTDMPVGDEPHHIPCRQPTHDDSTESMAVYPDHIHCYGCQFRVGRRMEALAYLLGITLSDAFRIADKYTVESLDAYRERATERERNDPLPDALWKAYRHLLFNHRRDRMAWLKARGLVNGTVISFGLGHDGTRFTIPILDADRRCMTIRFRRDDAYGTEQWDPKRGKERPIPKYSGTYGRNGLYLYPEWVIAKDTRDYLVLVEGELDAIRLWQEDIPAASVTNGAGNVKHFAKLLAPHAQRLKRLYLATDMDGPGQAAADESGAVLRAAGYKVVRLTWPNAWGKDVTELYLSGHRLKEVNYSHGNAHLREAAG